MGTKGSCKTSLANYLGKHLVFRMGEQDDGRIISFNVAAEGYEVGMLSLTVEAFFTFIHS